MPGITISSTGSEYDRIRDQFRNYAAWNGRDSTELFVDQGRKLATELYVQTAAIAPSKGKIAADVKSQGWKIPRKFPDGRLGRGVPAQWLGFALSKMPKVRGRRSRKSIAFEDRFLARKPKLADMQRFVIAMRSNARLYLASGWLGGVADLGGSLKTTSGAVDHARGGAIIRRGPGRVSFEFWNRTPGIEQMDRRHNFVRKAVEVRIADMGVYIERKRREALQRMKAA